MYVVGPNGILYWMVKRNGGGYNDVQQQDYLIPVVPQYPINNNNGNNKKTGGGKKSEKYERCVKKVKARQPKRCERQKWKGPGCYVPWAICNASMYGLRRK